MSGKEKLEQLIADIPEWLTEHAYSVLHSFLLAVAEADDDAFCLKLLNEYLAKKDKDEGVPIEEIAEKWGIELTDSL